jgi:hypothetical protein
MKDSYTATSSRQAQVIGNTEIHDEQLPVESDTSGPSDKPLKDRVRDAVSIAGPQGLTRDAIVQQVTSIDRQIVLDCIDLLLSDGFLVELKQRRRNSQGKLERVIVDVCNEALGEVLCQGERAR